MGPMANAHRTNVLVTSCLKTPVDPQTKAPLASYERDGDVRMDTRDSEEVRSSGGRGGGSGPDAGSILATSQGPYHDCVASWSTYLLLPMT